MTKALILGFGNVDRQDDGVAWHVLVRVSEHWGGHAPASPDDDFPANDRGVDFQFVLQLTPELGETLAQYERICFVDAHTGSVPAEVNIEPVEAVFQSSPLTHHMTPASCIALAKSLYGKSPEAILVSVRGYEFGFARELSVQTEFLAGQAAAAIEQWLANK